MSFRVLLFLMVVMAASLSLAGEALPPSSMLWVGPGIYRPFYPSSAQEKEIPVTAFRMDEHPVTNAQFFNFVQKHPQWKRDQVSKIFADEHYLAHWQSSLQLGPKAQANQPVTYVSWFAAKAYCESLSKRLPKEEEWEFAASSSESEAYAQNDPIWKQRILDWYAKPSSSALPEVKKQAPNFWKVYDLHGLVWEWVGDFNSSLVSSDSREGTDQKTRFCGSGGLKATDKEDYASFMRMAFRSSLRANYTTKNLGFRCAQ